MDALRQRVPDKTVIELGLVSRLAPLTLPLRAGAADFAAVFGPKVSASLAHAALARGLAHDPLNSAYRAAIAHLAASPPAKGVNPGGTEVKP